MIAVFQLRHKLANRLSESTEYVCAFYAEHMWSWNRGNPRTNSGHMHLAGLKPPLEAHGALHSIAVFFLRDFSFVGQF